MEAGKQLTFAVKYFIKEKRKKEMKSKCRSHQSNYKIQIDQHQ